MTLGPNTNAPADLLARDCILCGGEDRQTLLDAMRVAGLDPGPSRHNYRCYEFWRFGEVLLAWTGIGTGCIEPLLWELFAPGVIERLILVGTAGRLPESPTAVGHAYLVNEAWLAGTGLDGEDLPQPLTPRWPGMERFALASTVSTDFFYGFGPRLTTGGYPFATGRLRHAYDEAIRRKTGLVEMEVAQFYAFCAAFPHAPARFVAAKGVANTVEMHGEQVANSRDAIADTLRLARQLLAMP